jgi:hypothetical protein
MRKEIFVRRRIWCSNWCSYEHIKSRSDSRSNSRLKICRLPLSPPLCSLAHLANRPLHLCQISPGSNQMNRAEAHCILLPPAPQSSLRPSPRSHSDGGTDATVTELILAFPFTGDNHDFTGGEAFAGTSRLPRLIHEHDNQWGGDAGQGRFEVVERTRRGRWRAQCPPTRLPDDGAPSQRSDCPHRWWMRCRLSMRLM